MIIYGAGGGIMEATNRGAGANNSFGLNIKLPDEQATNSFIRDSANLTEFKYIFTRKLVFLKESQTTVIMPGGFRTVDKGFEKLTSFQTGKCMPRPIVLLDHNEDDSWDSWLDLRDSLLLENGFASTEDRLLIKRARNAEEALNRIKLFYRIFHSLQYAREKTVLRLNTPLFSELLYKLNSEFRDIFLKG